MPPLVSLLRTSKLGARNPAEETAAGALRVLAKYVHNRTAIAEAGGIELLIPLFEGASPQAKAEVQSPARSPCPPHCPSPLPFDDLRAPLDALR